MARDRLTSFTWQLAGKLTRLKKERIDCYQRSRRISEFVHKASYCSQPFQGSKVKARWKDSWGDYLDGGVEAKKPGASIGALLERIVEHKVSEEDLSIVAPDDSCIESRPSMPLSQWLQYVQNIPQRQEGNSESQVDAGGLAEEVLQIMDLRKHAVLAKFTGKLSMRDIVLVLSNMKDKTLAFIFYEFVKRNPNYIPNKYIFTAVVECLIGCLKSTDTWDKLQIVLEDMFKERMCLDNGQFQRLLVAGRDHASYNTMKVGYYENWFEKMKELGFTPHCLTYQKLMRICNLTGMHERTLALFKEMQGNGYSPLSESYQCALSACRGLDKLEMAEELWKEMKIRRVKQDAKCYTILLGFYGHHGDPGKAEKLFEEMQEAGVEPDLHAWTGLIHAYAKAGMIDEAQLLFRKINSTGWKLDPAIYRAMSVCYMQAGFFKELLALFKNAKESGIQIGASCYNAAIQACTGKGHWEIAIEFFKEMQACGMCPSSKLYCTMLHVYVMSKQYHSCEHLFFHMIERKLVQPEAFEIIIRMYIATGEYLCAVNAFTLMKKKQCPPTSSIYEQIIPLVTRTSPSHARNLYHEMLSAGQMPSLDVYTTLIEEHIKVGDVLRSRKFYEEMQSAGLQPNRHIFLSIISGYKEAGNDEEVFQIYQDWQKSACYPDKQISEIMICSRREESIGRCC